MSWPRTLANDPKLLREVLGRPLEEGENRALARVVPPCCGRGRMPADCIWDLRAVPGTIVAAGNRSPPRDHDLLCSRCVQQMIVSGRNDWTESRLAHATGAPADAIRHLRAREMARDEVREEHRVHGRSEPGKALDRVLQRLPKRRRNLPGTEAPGPRGKLEPTAPAPEAEVEVDPGEPAPTPAGGPPPRPGPAPS